MALKEWTSTYLRAELAEMRQDRDQWRQEAEVSSDEIASLRDALREARSEAEALQEQLDSERESWRVEAEQLQHERDAAVDALQVLKRNVLAFAVGVL